MGIIETTTTPATTTTTTKVVNTCVDKSHRLYNFTKTDLSSKDVFTRYFKAEVLAIVEVCTPNVSFVMHLGNKIIMIDDFEFNEIKSSSEIDLVWNFQKIKMIATKREIVISEYSDFIYRFDLDLKYINSKSLNDENSPIHCSGMYYDLVNDQLYVFLVGHGFHVLDSEYNIIKFYQFEVNEDIFFYLNSKFEVYLAIISTSETGYFDLANESYEKSFSVCTDDKKVISFQGDYNGTIMIGCRNENSSSNEIVVFQYGNEGSLNRNNFDAQPIIDSLIDSKNRLIFVYKDIYNLLYAIDFFISN